MQLCVEGLLIHKIPYQDHHVIAHLLLRSGRSISTLFYGGQGGGKKKKSSLLELGYMLSVELAPSPTTTAELYRAKDWKALWIPRRIRHHPMAFYLMCFYLEVIGKMALQEDLHDDGPPQDHDSHTGLFRVLSNALFHLEHASPPAPREALTIFLGKLLMEQGLYPQRQFCPLCEVALSPHLGQLYLDSQHGAFICSNCYTYESESRAGQSEGEQGRELWSLLGMIANHKYQDLGSLQVEQKGSGSALFHYLCFQYHFSPRSFKSLSFPGLPL